MCSTLRIFINKSRIATAAKNSSGSVYQVYPEKRSFANKDEWVQHWTDALKTETPDVSEEPCGRKSSEKPVVAPAPVAAKQVPAPVVAPISTNFSDWSVRKSKRIDVTLPAGKYYIGDLCYVLSDAIYKNILGKGGDYDTGIYTTHDEKSFFVLNRTFDGDGEWEGSNGHSFCVDSGTLGICSANLIAKNNFPTEVYRFKTPVRCILEYGVFTFYSNDKFIKINTAYDDEDDEDEDDDY